MKKIVRITTVSSSLTGLLKGQLGFMSKHYEMTGIASDEDNRLKDYEKREGVRALHARMTRKITPIEDLKSVFKLYRIIKREKPFIVHTHTPKAGTLGMLAARLAGVEHRLHTIAGLPLVEATGLKRKLLNKVEKFTYSCSTLILPNSFGLMRLILDEGFCKESKIRVLGNGSSNGIDTKHFNPKSLDKNEILTLRKKLNISNNDFIFLYVGRVVRDKGIKELVEAFNKLTVYFDNISLILVGSKEDHLDPLDYETESIIETNTKIYCVGETKNVKPYYGLSDVFVFPSYREGFPNVILEAGSMGVPCIVSDINGSNEIIISQFNGIIVPKKNSIELEKAMARVIKNPQLVNEMAKNARINIEQKYQRQDLWNEMLLLYKKLEKI